MDIVKTSEPLSRADAWEIFSANHGGEPEEMAADFERWWITGEVGGGQIVVALGEHHLIEGGR